MRDYQKQLFLEQAKHIYKIFPINGRRVIGTDIILAGDDIIDFLRGSSEIIIMAVTLGFEADRQISLAQKISMANALALDRAGSKAIEEVCNNIQAEISDKFQITKHRYSCGYGDLPLSIQPKILKALDTQRKIGLFCNENNLMIPMKSVTAFLGVYK